MTHVRHPAAMANLAAILKRYPGAVHEHTAIHWFGGLAFDAEHYKALGFDIVRRTDEIMFLQHERRTELRLEIIPPEWNEHDAWTVENEEDFYLFDRAFRECKEFELLEDELIDLPDLKAQMYRHRASGEFIQVIWRKNPTFRKVFPWA